MPDLLSRSLLMFSHLEQRLLIGLPSWKIPATKSRFLADMTLSMCWQALSELNGSFKVVTAMTPVVMCQVNASGDNHYGHASHGEYLNVLCGIRSLA